MSRQMENEKEILAKELYDKVKKIDREVIELEDLFKYQVYLKRISLVTGILDNIVKLETMEISTTDQSRLSDRLKGLKGRIKRVMEILPATISAEETLERQKSKHSRRFFERLMYELPEISVDISTEMKSE